MPLLDPSLIPSERLLRADPAPAQGDLEPPPGLIPPLDPHQPGARPLRVGQLARLSGKTVRALHLYEEMGLLEPTERSKGGYRLYASGSLTRVAWISHLQDLGFSLPEIRSVLSEWKASSSAGAAMQRVTELYRQKLGEARAQIARLRALEAELDKGLSYLETCETCEPVRAVEACGTCDRRECDTHAPVLVAGLTSH
jgi:MerR family copper efflux transcriptional regulator